MSNKSNSLKELYKFEFGNNPKKFLHFNSGETGYTLGGVYQKSNPLTVEWDFVNKLVNLCNQDIERASVMLFHDTNIKNTVDEIFIFNYWDRMKLDYIENDKVALEMFLFGVLAGTKNSVKIAQKIVGVQQDGIIGNITIGAINNYNEETFDKRFDELEVEYFEKIIDNNPKLAIYLNGWKNRAYAV